MAEREFRIAYSPGMRRLLGGLGCGPRFSGVLVTEDAVQVRLGWAFQATVPRHAIASAEPDDREVLSVGVHGWRGTWLVNGSRRDLARIRLGVGVHARVLGARVPLTTLYVSVEERDEFIRLIRPKTPGPGTQGRVSRARRIRLPSPGLKPGLARDVGVMTSDSGT
ncbi:hypothetical protein KIH74_08285 [Kineosporia sp. J2-2]|uniref:Uncharacterized protein n=1 Tax=Kineosporia corallincola TaxID=2835133 RepID=A0ABS5TCV5_9ACTN|nr:hypothetical protein [Kineosporia corallincola]MBT0768920.1 hypothetical protein [Kineosporia corallincola]